MKKELLNCFGLTLQQVILSGNCEEKNEGQDQSWKLFSFRWIGTAVKKEMRVKTG